MTRYNLTPADLHMIKTMWMYHYKRDEIMQRFGIRTVSGYHYILKRATQ